MTTTILVNGFQRLIDIVAGRGNDINTLVFGRKLGLIAKVFGCWHENVGRPFAHGKISYRSCLNCGARRQFDRDTFKTHGNFYSPPALKAED